MEKSEIFCSAGRCVTSVSVRHTDIIPKATPTFSTMADLNTCMAMSMSPDVIDYQFKMVDTKPELEITFER